MSKGLLKTAVPLDRERQSRYILDAHVQDREKSDWECVTKVEITMLDINDNAPLFISNNNNTASLSEDAQIGTIVIKMHATDADIGKLKFKYTKYFERCKVNVDFYPRFKSKAQIFFTRFS